MTALPGWERSPAFVFDATRSGSLAAMLASLHRAAAVVRHRISIDSWRILNGLRLELAPPLSADAEVPLGDVLSALNRLVLDLSAFAGMGTESMPRGPGWRFLDMGRRLERAYNLSEAILTLFIPLPEADEESRSLWSKRMGQIRSEKRGLQKGMTMRFPSS
mgnify:CR=1 FL=1